jgi:hypothetical protein
MFFKEYFVLSEMPHMQIDYELEQFSPLLPENAGLNGAQLIALFEEYMKKLALGQQVETRKNKNLVQIQPQEKSNFIEDITSEAFLSYFYSGVKLGHIKFPDLASKSKFFNKLDPQDKQVIKNYIISLVSNANH